MGRGQRWNPANLLNLRRAFGLSPEAFAERVGSVSASTVRRWESGRHVPTIRHLEAIADAFDIDLAVFFEPANPGKSARKKPRTERALPGQIELLPGRVRET
ncbi:MAG: helix-turn-helix domain-containing protein [Candidatus Binatia bacterium]